MTFGSFGLSILAPVFHGAFKYGWNIQNQRLGISWFLVTLVLNVTGATAYALKV
jgi:adiponectin receptor